MIEGTNPFATRWTRPGRLVSVDATGTPVDQAALLEQLDQLGGRAAIVGPHGSGKTTLLVNLCAAAEGRGWSVVHRRMRTRRDAVSVLAAVVRAPRAGLIGLDSWECLGPCTRWTVCLVTRLRGCRLLVTCHDGGGLPALVRCRPTPAVIEAIVLQLPNAADWLGSVITPADIQLAFARHDGDIREAFFDLYDRLEERRPLGDHVRL